MTNDDKQLNAFLDAVGDKPVKVIVRADRSKAPDNSSRFKPSKANWTPERRAAQSKKLKDALAKKKALGVGKSADQEAAGRAIGMANKERNYLRYPAELVELCRQWEAIPGLESYKIYYRVKRWLLLNRYVKVDDEKLGYRYEYDETAVHEQPRIGFQPTPLRELVEGCVVKGMTTPEIRGVLAKDYPDITTKKLHETLANVRKKLKQQGRI